MHFNTFDELFYNFTNHYIHKKGKAKYDTIHKKVRDSKHVQNLLYLSHRNRWQPNAIDFSVTISDTKYFWFAGFETTAMAEIIAMNLWDCQVNRNYNICTDREVLEKGKRALDRWKISF